MKEPKLARSAWRGVCSSTGLEAGGCRDKPAQMPISGTTAVPATIAFVLPQQPER